MHFTLCELAVRLCDTCKHLAHILIKNCDAVVFKQKTVHFQNGSSLTFRNSCSNFSVSCYLRGKLNVMSAYIMREYRSSSAKLESVRPPPFLVNPKMIRVIEMILFGVNGKTKHLVRYKYLALYG